jgi:Zn-dependent M16 (insulinase) family peptidase
MNAFTASDWTMYPFSTQNKKDFYNLMDVYLDSAFYPKIDELSFKQEGHRLEIEDETAKPDAMKLVYKGVVYNEMKGAMSSPSQVMGRSILNALYPSTTYRFNSGGDPAVIPSLTYEQLKAFHRRHYHPSNSFFYTYGNLPLEAHLDFIHSKILKHFERIDPRTDVPSQPRWSQARKTTYSYPLDKNEDPSKKYQICVAWLTADIKDSFEVLTLALLGQILLGNPGSPLRKALIDSKLGTALSDSTGYDNDNRDTLFTCGLKDVEASAADQIEAIIFDVLKDLAENGIDAQMVESAIHQLEFHRKEVTNTPYPYGIKLLLAFSGNWFHGGDPLRILEFDADLKKLRREIAKGPFFESRIRTYFLDNPHRVLLTLVPDQTMEEKERKRVAAEVDRMRTAMKPVDLEKIIEDAGALIKLQEDEEDVSILPTLALGEIPPAVKRVPPTSVDDTLNTTSYQQPTSGIFYFSAIAGSGFLPKHLIPLVPFFCHSFSKIGTSVRDYTEMAQRIDAYTGGVGVACSARTNYGPSSGCLPLVVFGAKCLVRNQDKMFDIVEELLSKFDFSDLVRLKRASRNFTPTHALSEAWHGIHQLQTIKEITDDLTDDRLRSVAQELRTIGDTLLSKENFKMALVGEEPSISDAASMVTSIQKGLKKTPEHLKSAHGFVPPEVDSGENIPREGWSTSTAVSFVAKTFTTVRLGHEHAPALAVISKILRSQYLHREIREKGGAYGGFALYNREDGLFSLGSYRDPHIVSTLNVYDQTPAFIKSGKFGDEDIKEAILQVCSEIDKPDPPGPAARKAFLRKTISLPDEMRQQFKEKLLEVNRKQVLEAAEKHFDDDNNHAVAVISSADNLKAANEKMPDNPLTLHKI